MSDRAMTSYSLTRLPIHYAVCALPPTAAIPAWAGSSDFLSITRTRDELSIICAQAVLPDDLPSDVQVARGWVLLRVEGPFDFDVVGVLATLAAPLAQAGVVILAVATYKTDYLLVKEEQLESAVAALQEAGHQVTR
jgi:hypothetical protein